MAIASTTKRGLTDPGKAAVILAAIPDHDLDTQRRMNYFVTPRWKRLSEYEILTLYTQPNPDWIAGGLDWGDWTQKFHGGRPSWGNESTELRTTDWYRHRDPDRRWHAPYVKDKAEEWRYTSASSKPIPPKARSARSTRYGATTCSTNIGARCCSTSMGCLTLIPPSSATRFPT